MPAGWPRPDTGDTTSNCPGNPPGLADLDGRAGRTALALERRVDKLAMLCCAMWTVIQAHTDIDDAELVRLARELDLADGHEDGKAGERQVGPCGSCRRPVALHHIRCIYCGTLRRAGHPFEGVL